MFMERTRGPGFRYSISMRFIGDSPMNGNVSLRPGAFGLGLFCTAALLFAGCPSERNGGGNGAGGKSGEICEENGAELDRPTEAPEKEKGGAPNFDCLDTPATVGPSVNVTVEGCIDIFGIGNRAKTGLKIAVFDIDQNPRDDTPAYGEVDVAIETQDGPLQAEAQACEYGGFYRMENIPTHTPLIFKSHDASDEFARAE
jgi:hypothetical protein